MLDTIHQLVTARYISCLMLIILFFMSMNSISLLGPLREPFHLPVQWLQGPRLPKKQALVSFLPLTGLGGLLLKAKSGGRHPPSLGFFILYYNHQTFALTCTDYSMLKLVLKIMQAMNFFAGLLLLLMPEENAFW